MRARAAALDKDLPLHDAHRRSDRAVTAMQTAYLHGTFPTVSTMQAMAQQATGAACPTTLSSSYDYVSAAQQVGNAPRSYAGYMSFEDIKGLVSGGTPVHVAVKYGDLGNRRCSKSWSGGHALLVVGYSQPAGVWRVHDPLCSDAGDGAYRTLPSVDFRAAIRDMAGGDANGGTVVVVQ